LIGFFINTVVLGTRLAGNPTFRNVLKRVREVTLGAYAHRDLPFVMVQRALWPDWSPRDPSAFPVLFNFLNVPERGLSEQPGLNVDLLDIEGGTMEGNLVLVMTEVEQELRGWWGYTPDVFKVTTIAQMHSRFQAVLESIVADPDLHLLDLVRMIDPTSPDQLDE
jgi:non-ribosomal peptide synthetase component F